MKSTRIGSGTVHAFKAYQRNAEGRPAGKLLLHGGLASGFSILALHFMQRIFFANGFLEWRHPGLFGQKNQQIKFQLY
jgi:hypothetical protein